jgi:hypothetical protein
MYTNAIRTIEGLNNHRIISKLIWDCRQSLMARHIKNSAVMCVPADQLAKFGSELYFIGPKPD